MRAISEPLAAWLVQHLTDAMALNTYHDGWNQRASELLSELSSEDPTDAPELEYLGEVRPGGKYLLRATDKITAEAADRVKQQLRKLFPGSEFGILTANLELVQPAGDLTKQELVATLREVARTWPPHTDMHTMLQELARALTKTGDGAATPPAAPTATPAPTGGEQADASSPQVPGPGGVWVCSCAQIDVTVDPSNPQTLPGLKDPHCPFHGKGQPLRETQCDAGKVIAGRYRFCNAGKHTPGVPHADDLGVWRDDAPSPQCDHWANEERGQGRCIHGKGHPDSLLHQDNNGNRWSW